MGRQCVRLPVLLLMLVVLTVLAGCGEPSAHQKVLHIGLIAPISGDLADVGRSTVEAAKLAVNEINDSAGLEVDGKPVTFALNVADDRDNVDGATGAVLQLVNQDRVAAIVGPQASRNAIPAAGIAERSQIPLISPWSTHPDTTRNKTWIFRVAYSDDFQGQVLARFCFDQLRLRHMAVLYDIASDYNRDLATVFRDRFEALGGEVVAFESYTRDMPDVRNQLERIGKSGADGLFLPNYAGEVADQARQLRQLGLKLTLIGSDTWAQIPPVHRRLVEGAYFIAHYATDMTDAATERFVSAYRQAYGHAPDDVAALTYDAFGLLAQAVRNGAALDPASIRDGLASIEHYRGVTGLMTYRGSGDPIKSAVIMQIHDGRFVVHGRVEP